MGDFHLQCRSKGFQIVFVILIIVAIFVLVCIATTTWLLLAYGKDAPNYVLTVITGDDPDMPSHFTGTWRRWFILGGVKEELEVKKGVPHGRFVSYYEDGKKLAEGFYENGKMHGKWIHWYDNEQKEREYFCKDGMEHGKIMEWDENGNLLSTTWKYEGQPVSKEEFEKLTASEDKNKEGARESSPKAKKPPQ